MNFITEDYLGIDEQPRYESGVDKVGFMSVDPDQRTDYNNSDSIRFTISKSDSWLLPSRSFIYIEGRISKADGTPYTAGPQGNYPDIAFVNNGSMFLFKSACYRVNEKDYENFTYAGYVTLMNGLMTKSSSFTGLDQCWALDNYNGGVDLDVLYYPITNFTDDEMAAVGGNPTAAEYRAIMKLIITRFNAVNNTSIINLEDGRLPCVGANPTQAEIRTAFSNLISRINGSINAPAIPKIPDAQIQNATTATLRQAISYTVVLINKTLINYDPFLTKNEGFLARKKTLFNPFTKVTPAANAGMFSFRIPLNFIFNFCSDYEKVMFNCKHQLELHRDSIDGTALFRHRYVDPGKVIITSMKWYIPQVCPSNAALATLYNKIITDEYTSIAFRRKHIIADAVQPNITVYPMQLTFSGGFGTPRFIVVGFQFVPDGTTPDLFNNSIFNCPTFDSDNMINVSSAVLYLNGTPFIQNDYHNDFRSHKDARWYNDFKNVRAALTGDLDDSTCVDFMNFVNLYRLYVFDISKQKMDFSAGSVNIKIEFNLLNPIPAAGKCTAYALTYYDALVELNNSGIRADYMIK